MKIILIILLLLTGCAKHSAKFDYVRKFKCTLYSEVPNSTYRDHNGAKHMGYGWSSYECPNGEVVVINGNEEQP